MSRASESGRRHAVRPTMMQGLDNFKHMLGVMYITAFALMAGAFVAENRGYLMSVVYAEEVALEASCLEAAAGPVLSGYDVVAYFSLADGADAVAGSAAHNASYGGYTFYFSTAANRATFLTEPSAYAPQFGGFCAWGIAEESQWTKATLGPDADPNVWQIVDDKLYVFMFDKPESKFMGTLVDDDLDASGSTATYVADGDARWTAWFGDDVAFNTGCFWWDASSDTAEKAANQEAPARP